MAQRRMFNKSVTNNDKFLEMPDSSQNLYFHLSMNADDDGFVDNWKSIMRMTGHKDDDLKVLITKNFVIPFESGVIVIRHWRLNNYLQKDRIVQTNYKMEKSQLKVDENNVYTLDTECIHSIDKYSIDKYSIDNNNQKSSILKEQDTYQDKCRTNCSNIKDKDRDKNNLPSLPENLDTEFDYLWKLYPNKQGKNDAKQKYLKYRKSGIQYQDILNGLNRYLNYIQQEKIPIQYIKHGSTWFNQKCWEDEYKTSNTVIQGERDKQNELLKGVYNGTIKID
ncbi:MAG: hypothetical protein MR938_06515 [Tenericutes bacterium]|nr:hypothetical protein [Mycoplasmatota bacterium]